MFFCNFDKLPHHNLGKSVNVVLFGESVEGKRSTVDLLLGRNGTDVNNLAVGVGSTFDFQVHETPNYTLYDTVGLSEKSQKYVQHSAVINQLISLLKRLEDGVSLIIFTAGENTNKKSLVENYKLFADDICKRKVPVILMVTQIERHPNPDKWWQENKCFFNKYGMHFDAVVCGHFMNPDANSLKEPMIKALNDTTASRLREAINAKILVPGWKLKGGWMNWLTPILNPVLTRLSVWFETPFTHFFPSEKGDFDERHYTKFLHAKGFNQIAAKETFNNITTYKKQIDEISSVSREEVEPEKQETSVNVRGLNRFCCVD